LLGLVLFRVSFYVHSLDIPIYKSHLGKNSRFATSRFKYHKRADTPKKLWW